MNPCPCGHLGSTVHTCRCTPDQVRRYQARLSGPLLDRIDLQVEVPALAPQVLLNAQAGEPTAAVRARCTAARQVALARQGAPNQALQAQALDTHAQLAPSAAQFLEKPPPAWAGAPAPRTAPCAWPAPWPTWPTRARSSSPTWQRPCSIAGSSLKIRRQLRHTHANH
jgi:hypothetical protein